MVENSTYDATEIFVDGGGEAMVYIHGGAWVDVNTTPKMFEGLSKSVKKSLDKDLSQYSIEYRLSPGVKHPLHLHDVLSNLARLVKDKSITKLHLLGHSVGATLCWQILTAKRELTSIIDIETLNTIRSSISNVFMVSGIYSLKKLLEEYPEYDAFVSKAFEDINDFQELAESVEYVPKNANLHIIHSYEDEKVTYLQPNLLVRSLQEKQVSYTTFTSHLGKHDDICDGQTLADYVVRQLS
ncbi:HFL206Wp [Eremothecium sinecaudum]|uniref:HFL206Wp n=1 Tax=Eremothecium sinecaudum TaxID=45286 RepID=A0A0X8HUH8_9SACH|nr:HFL206Wp [Eremothecium sinecaudum]AMD21650.1 HFL206Wp [Eremothecium sinecaudum]